MSPAERRARSTGRTARSCCIVSVLMLREGWQVRNVRVIVTSAATAKANTWWSRPSAVACVG